MVQFSFVLRKNAHLSYANSVDHDQMPGFAASGPDMHRLPFSLSGPQGINELRCTGTPPFFSAMISKGDNFCHFLFASLADIALLNWGLPLKERICSKRSKFFPLRVKPF